MSPLASLFLVLLGQAVFGDDILKDIVGNHEGTSTGTLSDSVTENGALRETRNYGSRSRPGSRTGGQSFSADRIIDQLIRQCNGDISQILSTLERRFNIRTNANADLQTRLDAIVTAANAVLSFSGNGQYRTVVNTVADRLRAMIRTGQITAQGTQQSSGSFSSNGNWNSGSQGASSSSWSSGSGQRPNQSQNWNSNSGSGQPPSWSSSGPTAQDVPNYWTESNTPEEDIWPPPMVHIPASTTPVYGSRPLFVSN